MNTICFCQLNTISNQSLTKETRGCTNASIRARSRPTSPNSYPWLSPDWSRGRGQLGEDHPREQVEGAEGEQEVPSSPKVEFLSLFWTTMTSTSFLPRFCDFVTGSSQELYELFADLKKMFHQTGYILQQVDII